MELHCFETPTQTKDQNRFTCRTELAKSHNLKPAEINLEVNPEEIWHSPTVLGRECKMQQSGDENWLKKPAFDVRDWNGMFAQQLPGCNTAISWAPSDLQVNSTYTVPLALQSTLLHWLLTTDISADLIHRPKIKGHSPSSLRLNLTVSVQKLLLK